MLVFNYIIRLYNQDVSVGAAPATAESVAQSAPAAASLAGVGSAHT
jgi:hypothetical protein